MAEDKADIEQVLTRAETAISTKGELVEGTCSDIFNWLQTDFKKEMLVQCSAHRECKNSASFMDINKKLSVLGRDFALSMHVMANSGKSLEWEKKIVDTLFGANSVQNEFEKKHLVFKDELVGSVSVLTFWQLLRETCPMNYLKDVRFDQMIAGEKEDVEGKIDLVLDFHTQNAEGKKIVRIIQLKGVAENDVRITRIDPENIKRDYFGEVTGEEAKTMIGKSKSLGYPPDSEFRYFVVLVPAFTASCVNNIFGVIKPGEQGKLTGIFKADGVKLGLTPKG